MWEGGGGEGGIRVPTSDPHTINARWFLFLLFAYLLVAEAASFDKKELCRSDTSIHGKILLAYSPNTLIFFKHRPIPPVD